MAFGNDFLKLIRFHVYTQHIYTDELRRIVENG